MKFTNQIFSNRANASGASDAPGLPGALVRSQQPGRNANEYSSSCGQGLGCIGRQQKPFDIYDFSAPRPIQGRFNIKRRHEVTFKPRHLTLWSTNICGLFSKFSALEIAVQHSKPDLLLLCETHVNSQLSNNNAFKLPGYECFRRDRQSKGGGVAIYYRSSLPCILVHTSRQYEGVWILLRLQHIDLLVLCCYNPPKCKFNIFERIERDLERFQRQYPQAKFQLFGDLNMHRPGFLLHSLASNSAGERGEGFAASNDLHQIVNEPTFYSHRNNGTIRKSTLDVCLTSTPELLKFTGCQTPIGNSDHQLLTFQCNSPPAAEKSQRPTKRYIYSFSKTNWTLLNQFLQNRNWHNVLHGKSVDSAWHSLHSILRCGIEQFTPKKLSSHTTTKSGLSHLFFHFSIKRKLHGTTYAPQRLLLPGATIASHATLTTGHCVGAKTNTQNHLLQKSVRQPATRGYSGV